MQDTHPDFFTHVDLLAEAARIRPEFGARLDAATNDEQVDRLVDEARGLVQEAADEN